MPLTDLDDVAIERAVCVATLPRALE